MLAWKTGSGPLVWQCGMHKKNNTFCTLQLWTYWLFIAAMGLKTAHRVHSNAVISGELTQANSIIIIVICWLDFPTLIIIWLNSFGSVAGMLMVLKPWDWYIYCNKSTHPTLFTILQQWLRWWRFFSINKWWIFLYVEAIVKITYVWI